jgi:hypothetical protein
MLVAAGAAAQTGAIAVVDGDPVKDAGVSQRLMGFDCPETFYARCPSERARRAAATRRLRHSWPGAALFETRA